MSDSSRARWILVVDDDEDFRAAVRGALELRGYRVLEAGDGQNAIEQLRRHHVSIMITDIYMPRVDGIELLQYLKDRYPRPGIIAVTGESHLGAFIAARAASLLGARVLLKPFNEEQLVRLLEDVSAAPRPGRPETGQSAC